jgi:thiol-disulfide isomerase/thioredoxin
MRRRPRGWASRPPSLSLPDLDGRALDLAETAGRTRALVFWNLGCGFCQQMLPQLKAWEAKPPKDGPELVIVSTSSEEENRGMGLRSAVVTDPQSRAATAYGAGGTPMGVLLDGQGRIASEVAAGADAVLELLSRRGHR